MSASPSAHDAAAVLIQVCHSVDALKLQKLLYFAAGQYAGLTGKQLFKEPIEAWDYGPVVHSVYSTYKDTEGTKPIEKAVTGTSERLDALAVGCLVSAAERFSNFSGAKMIEMTHETSPWADAYVDGEYRTKIAPTAISKFFETRQECVEANVKVLEARGELFLADARGEISAAPIDVVTRRLEALAS
jgi:uncharacterized phage-associated protein